MVLYTVFNGELCVFSGLFNIGRYFIVRCAQASTGDAGVSPAVKCLGTQASPPAITYF